MAIALVNNNRGTQTNVAASFDEPIDLPAGASIAVGNILILEAAYDNSGTAGVDPNMFVATSAAVNAIPGRDLRNNYWWRLGRSVRSSGGANDGGVVDIWICRVNNAYANGDDITVQWSFPVAGAVLRISEWSGIRPISYSVVTPQLTNGNGTSINAGAIAVSTGRLVLALAAIETNTAITGDADVLDGAWVTTSNNVANSGVDATSMTLFGQHKVVTGSNVQNWTVTKTGAADWAAIAVVLDTYTPTPASWISGNTHYPCPAGPEIVPVGNARAQVDTGTEYLFTHDPFPDTIGSQTMAAITGLALDADLPSSSIQQHIIAADLYEENSEITYDQVESVIMYVAAAGSGGTGAVVVGGGSVADAIAGVGGSYIEFDTTLVNPYLDITFDPATLTVLFPDFRVLRWGVRYLAWKDASSPTTVAAGEGFQFEIKDSRANGATTGIFNAAGAANMSPGAWLIANYQHQVQYETRWFGETNLNPRGKGALTSFNASSGSSWTVQDLEHMANGDQTVGIRLTAKAGEDPLQTNMFLDYIEAIVELVPERRLGTSTRKVSSQNRSFYPDGFNGSLWFNPTDSTNFMTLTSGTKVMAIREALPASPSDYYAAQTQVNGARDLGDTEAIGPALLLSGLDTAYDTLADQPNLRRALLSQGIIATPPQEMDNLHLAATTIDLMSFQITGSPYPAYAFFDAGNLGFVSAAVAPNQYVHVPGGQQYDRLKIIVRYDELTVGNLVVSVQQPLATPIATATITKAMVDAAPKYGFDGWAEVSVQLSVPITPTAGHVILNFTATTPVGAPWIVATALTDTYWYSYDPGDTADSLQEWDYAAVLQCPLADPTYIVNTQVINIPPTGLAVQHCAPNTMTVPNITLTNAGLYDWITIQRIVQAEVFDVAILQDPINSQVFVDYGCPWDLGSGQIYYRIRGYRASDHRIVESFAGPLMFNVPAPGALFGLASELGLWLYAPVTESGDLEVTYNPLNPITKVQLHGYNYQVALRSPEERGLSVTVPVLVDSLACASRTFVTAELYNETASKGQQAMAPTLFDPIRALEKIKRHQLLLPGGHHRWVILDAGSMTVRSRIGTYIAEIELTDALPPLLEPWI